MSTPLADSGGVSLYPAAGDEMRHLTTDAVRNSFLLAERTEKAFDDGEKGGLQNTNSFEGFASVCDAFPRAPS